MPLCYREHSLGRTIRPGASTLDARARTGHARSGRNRGCRSPPSCADVEFYDERPIVYSLETWCSQADVETRKTGVLELFWRRGGSAVVARLVPVFIEKRPYMPRLVTLRGCQAGATPACDFATYGCRVTHKAGALSLSPKRAGFGAWISVCASSLCSENLLSAE